MSAQPTTSATPDPDDQSLLRVLEERTFRRVGGVKYIEADVRITQRHIQIEQDNTLVGVGGQIATEIHGKTRAPDAATRTKHGDDLARVAGRAVGRAIGSCDPCLQLGPTKRGEHLFEADRLSEKVPRPALKRVK